MNNFGKIAITKCMMEIRSTPWTYCNMGIPQGLEMVFLLKICIFGHSFFCDFVIVNIERKCKMVSSMHMILHSLSKFRIKNHQKDPCLWPFKRRPPSIQRSPWRELRSLIADLSYDSM